MYKNKSSPAKCAKNEAALARSPEKTGLFLLILELHIWRLGTLLKRRGVFSPFMGCVSAAEVSLLKGHRPRSQQLIVALKYHAPTCQNVRAVKGGGEIITIGADEVTSTVPTNRVGYVWANKETPGIDNYLPNRRCNLKW